jgi:predicted alpha/beta hydrolase family esterase
MRTLILPGYSEHNRSWAEDISKELTSNGLTTQVHYWDHWKNKGNLSIKKEINNILSEMGKEKINLIAKSVGVMVSLNLIPQISDQVGKVVLCGIASVSGKRRKKLLENVLDLISDDRILCIQNKKDSFVPYEKAKRFYHSVNPKLKVIEKPRNDHNYPYPEEFVKFLES